MLFEGVPLEALPAAWQPAGDEDTVGLTLTGSGALLYDKRKHTEESIQSAAANPDTLGAALGYGSQPRPLSERAVTLLDPNGREVLALTTSDDTAAQSTEALDKLRNAGDTILNEPAAVALTRRLANRQSEAALVRRSQAPRVSFSMPRTVRVHLEIARDPDSFQLGTPPSKAKDMPSIAQAYTLSTSPITIAEVTRLTPAEARQALSQGANAADIARRAALPPSTVRAYTVTTKNGQATIVHTSAGEVYIDSSSLASDVERSGGGAQVYQAAQTYAANNGLQFRADSIVSPKAQVRRISQMISSVLRHNSTRHLNPLFTFRDGATGLQKQEIPDWIPADDVGNLHKLLATEHDIVRTAARAVGIDFDSLTYDPLRDTIIDGHRQEPLTEATFESLAARLDPGASGIGEATFLRAIVTGSAIRSPLPSVPWKSQTDDVLHQGGADAAGSDLRLVRVAEDLFYSRPLQAGERGQAAGASGQSGSKAGVSTGRSAGITAAGAADAAKLLNQAVPGLADGVRFVGSRADLVGEEENYHPEDWDAMQDAEAFHDSATGRTTVFLDQVTLRDGESPRRAVARVILHERIAHAGLQQLLAADPAFASRWAKLVTKIPADELQAITERYPELSGDRDALAQEWLAAHAEALDPHKLPAPKSTVGRAWQLVKDWLAKVFRRFNRSAALDNEVRDVLALAARAARNAAPNPNATIRVDFAKANPFHSGDAPKWLARMLRTNAGSPYRVQNQAARNILLGSPLPKAFVQHVEASKADIKAIQQTAAQLTRDLQHAITAEAKRTAQSELAVSQIVEAALTGAAPMHILIDDVLRERTRRARNFIDDMSAAIGNVVGGNLGATIILNQGLWLKGICFFAGGVIGGVRNGE